MKRREFLKSSAAAAAGIITSSYPAFGAIYGNESKKPNILMITCHDIGQHMGCYGVKTVNTYNLDRLAYRGIRFAHSYSTSGVCSPGRGSLLTGRYPQSNGLMGLTHAPWWWKFNDSEHHIAELLKDAGYETYLIGLNHVDHNPKRLGYQHILSKKVKAVETVNETKILIKNASDKRKPFFAKVGFFEVHRKFINGNDSSNGLFVPPWLQNTEEIKDDLASFQGTIKYFDERVGEILDALESSNIADNTLVIITSDHGIPYPGAKWTVRKAGIETPLIIYQPDTIFSGGKVVDAIISNVDVLPTIFEFTGIKIPGNIQGRSFMPFLTGKVKTQPRIRAFSQYTPDMKRDNLSRSVITDKYHLIRYFDQGRAVEYPVAVNPQAFADHVQRCRTRWGARPFAQLYDIKKDPYELNDIGSKPEYASLVKEMSKNLLDWMGQVNDPLLKGPLRTPYYDKAIKDLKSVE